MKPWLSRKKRWLSEVEARNLPAVPFDFAQGAAQGTAQKVKYLNFLLINLSL